MSPVLWKKVSHKFQMCQRKDPYPNSESRSRKAKMVLKNENGMKIDYFIEV
jgi:hypothetical protein